MCLSVIEASHISMSDSTPPIQGIDRSKMRQRNWKKKKSKNEGSLTGEFVEPDLVTTDCVGAVAVIRAHTQ